MEAGLWTRKGYSAPWMYHRVAGQYTLFEKHLVSDFSPCLRRPSSRVLQDSTNWHDAQHPPRWAPPRQEGPWFAGKDVRRAAASPKPYSQRSPTLDGFNTAYRRELCWGAAAAAERTKGHVGLGRSDSRGEPPARSPPSYEAHMLLRLRAGHDPRKENRPRPPPYVAPPSYEAPHRTVQAQPQPRACRATGGGETSPSPPGAAPKRPERACDGGPRAPGAARKRGHCQAKVPGAWSYHLPGARTWAGRRRPSERAEACWPRSPQPRSHTLPRVTKRPPASCPGPVPQGALPAGWGFSHTAGRLSAAAGTRSRGSRELLPRWKERGGSRAAGPKPRPSGGLMVIDATCVVIQTHYIPPARPERVRYVGHQSGATHSPAPPAPAPPATGSLEERASRILGLPLSELASFTTQPSGVASPRRGAEGRGPAEAAATGAAAGLAPPERGPPSPQQGSPTQPCPVPGPAEPPPHPRPSCPEGGRAAGPGQGGDGCAPAVEEAEPACGPRSRSYVRDLREAMSRIRRHTAPDSDSDEEPEKEGGPAGERLPRNLGRLHGAAAAALSYSSSSSSSLESSGGSGATVLPASGTCTAPGTGWQP